MTIVPLRKGPNKATKEHNCRRLYCDCATQPQGLLPANLMDPDQEPADFRSFLVIFAANFGQKRPRSTRNRPFQLGVVPTCLAMWGGVCGWKSGHNDCAQTAESGLKPPFESPHFRVFGKGVSKKEFQVVRTLCSQVRSFLPPKQKRNTPRNFEMKRLFRNAFYERVRKRSVTKGVRMGYLAHVPRYVPFYLQTSKGIPLGTST